MKQQTSHRVNSIKHLKELISGRYFTIEFEDETAFHQWSQVPLIAESYRIPNKLRESLSETLPFMADAKKLILFEDYKQARKFIEVNLTYNLPHNKGCWRPLIITMATQDSILYYGHQLMRYWLNAKKAHDENLMKFFHLGQRYRYLYKYCQYIQSRFNQL